jgi:CheY-like chemotaxis protein
MRTPLTILVVEDDPAVLLVVTKALQAEGYRVVIAAGPITAMDRIAEYQPDGMILDIRLPGMLGSELLQLLRSPDAQHTPAIAMTGDPDIDPDEMRAIGFVTLLRKPFTVSTLKEAVAYFIG